MRVFKWLIRASIIAVFSWLIAVILLTHWAFNNSKEGAEFWDEVKRALKL